MKEFGSEFKKFCKEFFYKIKKDGDNFLVFLFFVLYVLTGMVVFAQLEGTNHAVGIYFATTALSTAGLYGMYMYMYISSY